MRKLVVFLYIVLLTFSAAGTESYPELEKYVHNLVNDGSTMLGDKQLSEEEKISRARKLITENLDLEWMSRYTLGRYKKTLSPDQIAEFTKIYSQYVIDIYSDMVKNYNGQKALVKQTKHIGDKEFIVKMQIQQSNGRQPIKVDYLIVDNGQKIDNFNVGDIITEGVSMINSQQDEFSSIISSKGFDSLLVYLKNKSSK